MNVTLYNHQTEGFDFAMGNVHPGTLLWHEMGLGKTLTAIIILRALLAKWRSEGVTAPKILILLPKSLIHPWKAEIQKFAPDIMPNVFILPYSQLSKAQHITLYYDFRCIVMDESHYMKTQGTQRLNDFCNLLCAIGNSPGRFQGGRYLSLSGTPMLNHAGELFTTWALLTSSSPFDAAEKIADIERYDRWKKSFTKIKMKSWKTRHGERRGNDRPSGVENEHLLNQLISPIVHYRRAADCLDLPPVQEVTVDLGLDDDSLLQNAELEKSEEFMRVLAQLAEAKTPHAVDWVKNFYKGSQEQLIIFSPYKHALAEIAKKFPKKCVRITGDENDNERRENLKAFQSGQALILLTTYKAGGVGLNLQNAFHSLYLGWPWTPGDVAQAMARTNRSGQKNRTLHYFLTSGQNDRNILGLIRQKERDIQSVENSLLTAKPALITGVDRFI